MTYQHLVVIILACIALNFSQAFAAQSTADVSASDSLKAEALGKVTGDSSLASLVDKEYVVGHGDILGVEVYGEGSMAVAAPGPSTEGVRSVDSGVQVRIDGRISLRHIGDVQAVGMTLTQLADYLKVLYSTVFEDPIVTTVLNQSNSQKYTVMGKVVRPGIYFIDSPITILQVVARSGGFTEWANSELTLVRKGGAKDSKLFDGNTLNFDYDRFVNGEELNKNILIRSGDILIVH